MAHVKSKHLFNFKLNGVIPEDVIKNENKWCDKPGSEKIMELWDRMEKLEPKDDPKSIQEYVEVYRKSAAMEWGELGKHAIFDEAKENCLVENITVTKIKIIKIKYLFSSINVQLLLLHLKIHVLL